MAKLYGIGVGPGDKELLTIKGLNAIKDSKVIVAPCAKREGRSIALDTVKDYINENTEIIKEYYPMGKEDTKEKILKISLCILDNLKKGKNVSFITIGDPLVYSTYIYILKHVEKEGYKVETIPGVTSFCACASIAKKALVYGNEPLLILPASKVYKIKDEKFVVIMKVYKKEEKVINLLEEKGFDYVYVKRATREGEEVLTKKEDILNSCEYMSMIIASR